MLELITFFDFSFLVASSCVFNEWWIQFTNATLIRQIYEQESKIVLILKYMLKSISGLFLILPFYFEIFSNVRSSRMMCSQLSCCHNLQSNRRQPNVFTPQIYSFVYIVFNHCTFTYRMVSKKVVDEINLKSVIQYNKGGATCSFW